MQFNLIEAFLGAMAKRGFSEEEGMRLFNIIGLTGFAGAVEVIRQREFEYQDESMEIVARRQFERFTGEQFPMVELALATFTQSPEQKTSDLFEFVLRSIARDRGEDESSVMREAE